MRPESLARHTHAQNRITLGCLNVYLTAERCPYALTSMRAVGLLPKRSCAICENTLFGAKLYPNRA